MMHSFFLEIHSLNFADEYVNGLCENNNVVKINHILIDMKIALSVIQTVVDIGKKSTTFIPI